MAEDREDLPNNRPVPGMVPTTKQPMAPTPGQIWQHHSGRYYRVIFVANDVPDPPRMGYPPTVVYEGTNGHVWAGPLGDWHRRMTFHDPISTAVCEAFMPPFARPVDTKWGKPI